MKSVWILEEVGNAPPSYVNVEGMRLQVMCSYPPVVSREFVIVKIIPNVGDIDQVSTPGGWDEW